MTPRSGPAARLLAILLPALLAAAYPAAAEEPLDDLEAAPPEEPIDLRRADLADLLRLPDMDGATAAALLACRGRRGLDLEALFDCAAVSPARRADWRASITWGAERVGPSAAGTLALRGREGMSVPGGEGDDPPPTWLRREVRLRAHGGAVGVAFRARRDGAAVPRGTEDSLAAVPTMIARARLARGACLVSLGDLAPQEGLGYLVGLVGRGTPRGVVPYRAPAAALEGWAAVSEETIDRAAPAGGARRLRGAAFLLGGRLLLSGFRYHPGDTGSGVDSLAGRLTLPGLLASLWLGVPPDRSGRAGVAMAPRILWLDGRPYGGLLLTATSAGALLLGEAVRDPAGRVRAGITIAARRTGGTDAQLTAQFGSPGFVNPLGQDSERAPVRGADLSTGRNAAATGAGASLRVRARGGLWLTAAAAATLDPPSTLRAFRRGRGDLRAGVEANLGARWSARGDLRLETRESPGPSDGVDAPLRRPGLLLRLNHEGRNGHLRVGWLTRLDLDLPRGGAGTPGVARAASMVDLRGRCRVSGDLWLGGGIALFDLPDGAMQTLYEERPRDLSPAVTLRGHGVREHLALEVDLPFGAAGAFLARERLDGSHNTFWGSVLRVVPAARGRGGPN